MPNPPLIMLIRHAEKPDPDQGIDGVEPSGKHSDHSLIVRGWQRAGALVALFASVGPRPGSPLRTPAYIYAAGTGDKDRLNRSMETVQPLADALKIASQTRFAVGDEDDAAKDILRRDGPVLVAWEHHNLPRIVEAILGDKKPPAASKWPGDRFDVIWLLTPDGQGSYTFSALPQMLLAGDGPV
jgi:hypothetical protein